MNKHGARVLETIEATIKENGKTDNNNSSSNDSSEKRRRNQAEGEEDFGESTERSKKRVLRKQFSSDEVVDYYVPELYDESLDNSENFNSSNFDMENT